MNLKNLALVFSAVLTFSAVAAQAAPSVLSCDEPPGALTRQVTMYKLFLDPDGNQVAVFNDAGYTRYVPYKIVGNELRFLYPVDITYDISNPNHIERKIHDCVRAAYGGDVTCVDVVQTCVLN